MTEPVTADPRAVLSSILYGGWAGLTVRAMVELGLPDHLVTPVALEQLADATSTHAPTLRRLLAALTSLGLVTRTDGRYELTPAGELLVTGRPDSRAAFAQLFTAPWQTRVWEELPTAVRTGTAVFADVHGCGFWEYLGRHPDQAAMFDAAMAGGGPGQAAALLQVVDVAGVKTVVDVGGGKGGTLAALLGAVPTLRGVLADRPEVVAAAGPVLEAAGVADRCDVVPSDFFVEVPAGGDAYVLGQILHDWPEEDCRRILRTIRAAMAPDARLWVVEEVLAPDGQPPGPAQVPITLLDLAMLICFGSQERTGEEYAALLESCGFTDVVVREGGVGWSVIEAVPG